jgi:site-specific recombinase XerD
MTVQEGMERYLSTLRGRGYGEGQLRSSESLLRRWFQYGLAIHHPTIPALLSSARGGELEGLGVKARASVAAFLERFRAAGQPVRYLNLLVFLQEHPGLYGARERAVRGLLARQGGTLELEAVTESFAAKVLSYLDDVAVGDACSHSRAFLAFCFDNGWLEWNPYEGQPHPTQRVLEPEFFGPAGARWGEHGRAYLRHLREERNLALGGLDYYARKLKVVVQWLEANRCRSVQLDTLKAFIEHKRSQGVAEATLSKYLYCIRPFLDYLIRSGRLRQRDNPADELRIKANQHAERQTLSQAELKQLIDFLEQEVYRSRNAEELGIAKRHFGAVRDLALVLLFVLCGLRLSEVGRMRVEDVEVDKRALRIVAKGNRRARGKLRELLVDELLWKRLTEYLRCRHHPGQPALWISWNGRPLRIGSINRIIHTRIAQTGITKVISPHALRATCASLYVKKGMDPYSLKTLLGHESLKTTMDHYTKLTEEELREVWRRSNPLAGYDDE